MIHAREGDSGYAVDLSGTELETHHIIQEEIVQLVGAHQILCLLGNNTVRGRKQLRAHRCIQHILQNGCQFRFPAGIRIIAHQMADESLRHRTVYPVHGHMVPVVSCPSKSQLRQIPCSDHKATAAVGNVHDDLGPLPGLCVFKGHTVVLIVMTDVLKMLQHCLFYVNLTKRGSQPSCEFTCIGICPVRGAEAGHGHRCDLASGKTAQIKGSCSHQKGKGGIQTAGNAQNCSFASCMVQTFFKTHGLHGEDLITSSLSVFFIIRHKGAGVKETGQGCLLLFHMEGNLCIFLLGFRLPGRDPSSLAFQALHINFTVNGLIGKAFCLPQNGSVLRDQILSSEYQILGGLPVACGCIYISADEAGGLSAYQFSSVGILSCGLVAG